MLRSLFASATLLLTLSASAQGGFTCGNNELHRMESLHQNRPDRLQDIVDGNAQLEAETQQWLANEDRGGGGPYILPVVFHIIHNNGLENISDEQVLDAMRILNEDFNKLNSDWQNVNAAFLGIVADIGVEFRLRRTSPTARSTRAATAARPRTRATSRAIFRSSPGLTASAASAPARSATTPRSSAR